MPAPKDIDEYIAAFPQPVRKLLEQMRTAIHNAAPKATETMSYGIPAFRLDKIFVWFAGYKNHIGFYPGSTALEMFDDQLSAYKRAKGSVRFPIDKPLPLALVSRMVKFRLKTGTPR